ncbi:MAG: hypothetical protein QJR14_07450 [Bacillota bacterium]|nr:hypothetical protein [Bacillota bacterium]
MERGTLPRGIWIPVLTPTEGGEPAFDLLEENLAMAAGAEPAGFVVLGAWSEPEALGPEGRRELYRRTLAASERPVVLDLRTVSPGEARELVRLARPAGFLAEGPPPEELLAVGLPWARALPPAGTKNGAGRAGAGPARADGPGGAAGAVPLWAESLESIRPSPGGGGRLPEGLLTPVAAVAPWQAADLWRAVRAAADAGAPLPAHLWERLAALERRLAGRVERVKLAMELEGYFGGAPVGAPGEAGAEERGAMYALLLDLGMLRGG